MNWIKRYWIFVFGVISIFAGCKKNVANGPNVISLYTCNDDQNSKIPYICFDSLIIDSRCPANATCIWAGYAQIKISFHENGNTHLFQMATAGVNKIFGENDTTINGYHIVFSALDPYPGTSNTPVSTNDLKATINITR